MKKKICTLVVLGCFIVDSMPAEGMDSSSSSSNYFSTASELSDSFQKITRYTTPNVTEFSDADLMEIDTYLQNNTEGISRGDFARLTANSEFQKVFAPHMQRISLVNCRDLHKNKGTLSKFKEENRVEFVADSGYSGPVGLKYAQQGKKVVIQIFADSTNVGGGYLFKGNSDPWGTQEEQTVLLTPEIYGFLGEDLFGIKSIGGRGEGYYSGQQKRYSLDLGQYRKANVVNSAYGYILSNLLMSHSVRSGVMHKLPQNEMSEVSYAFLSVPSFATSSESRDPVGAMLIGKSGVKDLDAAKQMYEDISSIASELSKTRLKADAYCQVGKLCIFCPHKDLLGFSKEFLKNERGKYHKHIKHIVPLVIQLSEEQGEDEKHQKARDIVSQAQANYEECILNKFRDLVAGAEHIGADTLILGKVGTGAFNNDEKEIATLMGRALADCRSIKTVVFPATNATDSFFRKVQRAYAHGIKHPSKSTESPAELDKIFVYEGVNHPMVQKYYEERAHQRQIEDRNHNDFSGRLRPTVEQRSQREVDASYSSSSQRSDGGSTCVDNLFTFSDSSSNSSDDGENLYDNNYYDGNKYLGRNNNNNNDNAYSSGAEITDETSGGDVIESESVEVGQPKKAGLGSKILKGAGAVGRFGLRAGGAVLGGFGKGLSWVGNKLKNSSAQQNVNNDGSANDDYQNYVDNSGRSNTYEEESPVRTSPDVLGLRRGRGPDPEIIEAQENLRQAMQLAHYRNKIRSFDDQINNYGSISLTDFFWSADKAGTESDSVVQRKNKVYGITPANSTNTGDSVEVQHNRELAERIVNDIITVLGTRNDIETIDLSGWYGYITPDLLSGLLEAIVNNGRVTTLNIGIGGTNGAVTSFASGDTERIANGVSRGYFSVVTDDRRSDNVDAHCKIITYEKK